MSIVDGTRRLLAPLGRRRGFAFAELGGIDVGPFRLSGPGLGNCLFPWARMIVAARRRGLVPIWPTWVQIKLGPLLRRERDLRHNSGLFAPAPGYVAGARKQWVLAVHRSIDEEALLADPPFQPGLVVRFRGLGTYFHPLVTAYRLVRDELLRIVQPRHRRALSVRRTPSIAVHVRLGDYPEPTVPDPARNETDCRMPLDWYVHVVAEIRRSAGWTVPVRVFSDGRDAELAPLLAVPATRRETHGSSVADLLALSSAPVLVASASTFSSWASFLGRMPVVHYAGTLRQRLYYDRVEAEAECAPGASLPESFLRTIDWSENDPVLDARTPPGTR
jgi:hypothetical protein